MESGPVVQVEPQPGQSNKLVDHSREKKKGGGGTPKIQCGVYIDHNYNCDEQERLEPSIFSDSAEVC